MSSELSHLFMVHKDMGLRHIVEIYNLQVKGYEREYILTTMPMLPNRMFYSKDAITFLVRSSSNELKLLMSHGLTWY